jgi:phage-related protein
MPIPILELDPDWEIQEVSTIDQYKSELNDGYKQTATKNLPSSILSWEVRKTGLSQANLNLLLGQLETFAGSTPFSWRPTETVSYRAYFCDEWTVISYDTDCWQISGKFVQDVGGECVELLDLIDTVEITNWLAASDVWLTTYTRNTLPLIMNSVAGKPYLLVNSFHDVLGRGGYFPGSAGTTEGQFLMIRACMDVFNQTGIASWRQRAIDMAVALEPSLYRGQTVPADPNTLWLPHWVFNVKAPFTSKGLNTAPNPLNYGYFDLPVTFTAGVGQISAGAPNQGDKLSDVYSVYATGAKLLWQNVFAPVVFGTQYQVEYWVVNFMLGGQNFRIYPSSASSNGAPPLATTEPAGRIKLTTAFTGSLKVTYAAYTGSVIVANQVFDPYPFWRTLLPGEINSAFDVHWWAYDAYVKLAATTGLLKWTQAAEATRVNTINTAVVQNPTNWYKTEDNPNPFGYPGSQAIQVDNPNGYTASRETAIAGLLNTLKLVVAAAPGGTFPSIEVQNFAVQAQINAAVTIEVAIAQTTTATVRIALSLSPNAFDFSQTYYVNWHVEANTTALTSTSFIPENFFRWDNNLVWHLSIAETPIYVFSGGGGSATTGTFQATNIPYLGKTLKQAVGEIQMNAAAGFAGAGLVLIGRQVRRPPQLAFRTDKTIILRLTDGEGYKWDKEIANTGGWVFVRYPWSAFEFSPNNIGEEPQAPDTQNDIQNIEFIAVAGEGLTTVRIWWASEGTTNPPAQLPIPAQTYKAAVVSRNRNAHTFWVGNFRPANSPSDQLKYNPGVVPFTVNIVNGVVDAWRGLPYMGYQDPELWFKWGLTDRCQQVLDCLDAAQDAYAASTGVVGAFAPVFKWGYWDGGDYLGGLNTFSWSGADPNTSWGQYFYRPLEATAKYWSQNPGDRKADQIVMRGLAMLDAHYLKNNTSVPFTDFPQGAPPFAGYNDPAASALIGRAAVYANLAGGSPSITLRVINRTIKHLQSQYVSTGIMAGTWSAGQPTFVSGGTIYREFFGFWLAEIYLYLALLLEKKNALVMPPCGTRI